MNEHSKTVACQHCGQSNPLRYEICARCAKPIKPHDTPQEALAAALGAPGTGFYGWRETGRGVIAKYIITALTTEGWSIVPTAELERLRDEHDRLIAEGVANVIGVHRDHMTDGHWHDDCWFCIQRRRKGGTGIPAIDDLQQQLAAQAQRVSGQTKALLDLLDCMPPCRCNEGFTSRNLVDPGCARHYDFDEEIIDAARQALTEGE